MLVATPGQTTAYSTLHNSGNTATAKKSTLTSNTNASSAVIGAPKTLINNNHNTSATSTNNISYSQHHQNHKNDNKNNNTTTTSSKDLSTTKTATHSLKADHNSTTKPTNFIQTLKDSVQKALISTTGICSIANKHNSDNKLQNSNNSITTNATTTSLPNVTSSTTNNIAKAAAITSAAIVATATTSSFSLVRNKYSSCALSKLHTIAPTILHRYPEDREHTSSTDSLQKEMCHFKPIRTAPTTPWKSGSKSRGNSLRFPKANFATKKVEFILKSNCDVNNRKKKYQQQQQLQNDYSDEDGDNQDEQENKEYYGIYKPKPSSMFLSSSVTTPNHQSAFVCLVAQMKNLVNIQSKKRITSGKAVGRSATSVVGVDNLELTKTKSTRPARKAKDANNIDNTTTSATNVITANRKAKSSINLPVKDLFVRQNKKTTNKLSLPEKKVNVGLVKTTRSSRRVTLTAAAKKKHHTPSPDIEGTVIKNKPPKSADILKISPVSGITKTKSRRKIGSAKSKVINIVQLASSIAKDKLQFAANRRAPLTTDGDGEAKNIPQANKRKRKISQVDLLANASPSSTNTSLRARKSARLSRDICNKSLATTTTKKVHVTSSTSSNEQPNPQRSAACVSPPLTRARLKYLNQELGKVTTTVTKVAIKKRKH